MASAREPRLHGADRHAQRERNLVVAQAVYLAQHHHALMVANELRAGNLIPGRTPLHQRGFAATDVGPADDALLFHEMQLPPRRRRSRPDRTKGNQPDNSFDYNRWPAGGPAR